MRLTAAVCLALAGCSTSADPVPAGGGFAGVAGSTAAGEGGAGGAGGEAGAGGEPVLEDGSWQHPFLIAALPFSADGDTSASPSSVADAYWPCAPDTDERGPEVVYRLTLPLYAWVWARVDDQAGDEVDVDVHLLAAPDAAGCVTRDDVELGAPLAPGDYWLAVDTWVDAAGQALPGPYHLEVGLVTEAGADCYLSPISCDPLLAPYVNGVPSEAPGEGGCPPGMLRVAAFCVDRYEAMLVEVLADGTLAPFSPYAHPDGADVLALSVAGVVPQGHVSQLEAAAGCARAGKRLCSDDEWLRACQGAAATIYPYGDERQPGVCNDARDCHPVIQRFESDDAVVWSWLDDPCISQLPEGLALTGQRDGCRTDAGAFDMMGNLHEWTADPAGTFRGGFYVDTSINGDGCLYATTAHSVGHWDYSTGFRCCADP